MSFKKKFSLLVAFTPWIVSNDMLRDKEDEMSQFFLAFAGLSGTLLGFVISGLSIMMAISGRKTINNMIKTGHYKVLMKNLWWTGVFFFLSMLCAIASFFWSNVYVWKFNFTLFVISIMTLVVAGYRFSKIISLIKPEGNPNVLD